MDRPELEERTGIDRDDVPERFVPSIEAGNEQPTLAEARQLVANIEADIDDDERHDPDHHEHHPDRSTTSTTAGTTTTQAN